MVDGQRQVGRLGLTDRLAVVDGLDRSQGFQLFLHAVGDFVEDARAFGWCGAAPGILGGVGGIERELDVLAIVQTTDPSIGDMLSNFWPFTGGTHLPPMKLS